MSSPDQNSVPILAVVYESACVKGVVRLYKPTLGYTSCHLFKWWQSTKVPHHQAHQLCGCCCWCMKIIKIKQKSLPAMYWLPWELEASKKIVNLGWVSKYLPTAKLLAITNTHMYIYLPVGCIYSTYEHIWPFDLNPWKHGIVTIVTDYHYPLTRVVTRYHIDVPDICFRGLSMHRGTRLLAWYDKDDSRFLPVIRPPELGFQPLSKAVSP